MKDTNLVSFTPAKLAELKAIYETRKVRQGDTFEFDGNTYVVAYAKYLIQYLEAQFAGKDPGFKL